MATQSFMLTLTTQRPVTPRDISRALEAAGLADPSRDIIHVLSLDAPPRPPRSTPPGHQEVVSSAGQVVHLQEIRTHQPDTALCGFGPVYPLDDAVLPTDFSAYPACSRCAAAHRKAR